MRCPGHEIVPAIEAPEGAPKGKLLLFYLDAGMSGLVRCTRCGLIGSGQHPSGRKRRHVRWFRNDPKGYWPDRIRRYEEWLSRESDETSG